MMAQENQGTPSATPESLPVKRKRGRPRKDGTEIGSPRVPKVPVVRTHTPAPPPTPPTPMPVSSPAPEIAPRNQRRRTEPPVGGTNDPLVGKLVQGVLDGSFDAGYLLTVKVGDTDTYLRGVVFRPGLSVPVTGANDLAPNLNMLRRTEVPIPMVSPLNMVPGSTSQSIQKIERPGELPQTQVPVTPTPIVALQASASQLQTSDAPSQGPQNNINPPSDAPSQGPQNNINPPSDAPSQGPQNNVNPPATQIQTGDAPSQGPQNNINQSASQLQTSDAPSQGENGTNQSTPQTSDAASVGQQNSINKDPEHALHPPEPKPKDAAQGHLVDVNEPIQFSSDPTPLAGAKDDSDATKGLKLEQKAPSMEISLNDVPVGEEQVVGSKLQPVSGVTSMFQATEVVAPQPPSSGPTNEPVKTLQDEPQISSTVSKDAVMSESSPSKANDADTVQVLEKV